MEIQEHGSSERNAPRGTVLTTRNKGSSVITSPCCSSSAITSFIQFFIAQYQTARPSLISRPDFCQFGAVFQVGLSTPNVHNQLFYKYLVNFLINRS